MHVRIDVVEVDDVESGNPKALATAANRMCYRRRAVVELVLALAPDLGRNGVLGTRTLAQCVAVPPLAVAATIKRRGVEIAQPRAPGGVDQRIAFQTCADERAAAADAQAGDSNVGCADRASFGGIDAASFR